MSIREAIITGITESSKRVETSHSFETTAAMSHEFMIVLMKRKMIVDWLAVISRYFLFNID